MTSTSTHQQSLADAGSETRPPMLKKGSYVPWSSRFMIYIDRTRETRKFLRHSIEKGPYQMKKIPATDIAAERFQVLYGTNVLAKKDEVGVILSNEQNDFLLADASEFENLKELKFNDGKVEHDKNAHDRKDNAMELLASSAYKEAEKQLLLAKKVNQRNVELTNELESSNVHTNVRDTKEIIKDATNIIQKDFTEDGQVMMNAFDSMESDLDETLKQNEIIKVIHIVLWIVDSGYSKYMNGNLKLLRNFVEKFMGTVHFRNDHFAAIIGYGDYVHENVTIFAFHSITCYVCNVEGEDLLKGACDSNLYTISISDMAASSPV
ncbi:hypothetical protein Tco_0874649 [Tanacetum coccineum]|uniref:Integrase, catalytic region, zinc finger, CCHC-type, peptidase aspartic, catalytic n=1 Tax=Tanacetum coccineum TaxID=301880 RepID=A0ABQ5BQ81_9ASTR